MTMPTLVVAAAAALVLSAPAAVLPGAAQPLARFVPHTIATGLAGGYQVVVTDLNRDGRRDVIVLAADLDELRWYENPGWEAACARSRHAATNQRSGLGRR